MKTQGFNFGVLWRRLRRVGAVNCFFFAMMGTLGLSGCQRSPVSWQGAGAVEFTNPTDTLRRVVFETRGGVVTEWRVGLVPQVEWVERCG